MILLASETQGFVSKQGAVRRLASENNWKVCGLDKSGEGENE